MEETRSMGNQLDLVENEVTFLTKHKSSRNTIHTGNTNGVKKGNELMGDMGGKKNSSGPDKGKWAAPNGLKTKNIETLKKIGPDMNMDMYMDVNLQNKSLTIGRSDGPNVKEVMGIMEILSKDKHSVVIFEKHNKENFPSRIEEKGSTSAIRRTERGGGRPPDKKNPVVLKSRKVVKMKNARNALAGIVANIPDGLVEETMGVNEEDEELTVAHVEDEGCTVGDLNDLTLVLIL